MRCRLERREEDRQESGEEGEIRIAECVTIHAKIICGGRSLSKQKKVCVYTRYVFIWPLLIGNRT